MFVRRILATNLRRSARIATASRVLSRSNTSIASAGTTVPAGTTENASAKVSPMTLEPQKALEPVIAKHPHNQGLVDLFTHIANEETKTSLHHLRRYYTLTRLVMKIGDADIPITTAAQLYELYIGVNFRTGMLILDRLCELIPTGKLPFDAEEVKMVSDLARLPGMGPHRIRQIAAAGCKSVHELAQPQYQRFLTPQQKICIEFCENLEEKDVSLETANAVLDFCKQNTPSSYQWTLVGDHRRDVVSPIIRLIVAHPDHIHVPLPPPLSTVQKSHKVQGYVPTSESVGHNKKAKKKVERPWTPLQSTIIPLLTSRGLIAANSKKLPKSWKGLIRVPGLIEQEWQDVLSRNQAIKNKEGEFCWMKIHMIPQKSLGAALIHLTGDSEVLRWLKGCSLKKGLYLNDYGLWRWVGHEAKSENADIENGIPSDEGHWEMLQAYTEEEVFKQIGLDFIPPQHRNFHSWIPDAKLKGNLKKSFAQQFAES